MFEREFRAFCSWFPYLLLLIIVYCTSDEGRHVQQFRQCSSAGRGILANRDAFGNTARKIGQAIQQRAVLERLVRTVKPGSARNFETELLDAV